MVSEDLPAVGMGGLARHVLALARGLSADGHTVDLMGNDDVTPAQAGDEFDFEGRFFPDLHGQFDGWKEMRAGVFMPPKRSLIARRFAQAILRRATGYEVIHYHGHLPNIAYYLPPSLNFIQTRHDQGSDCLIHVRYKRGRICVSDDPIDCAECRTWKPNALQRFVSAAAVTRFRSEVRQGFLRHKTVFVSELLQRNLARSFGEPRWGVTVHNFVDTGRLQTLRLRARLPDDGRLRVFIAAKLYPAKGVEAFLDALAARPDGRLQVEVAGDGADEGRLRQRFPAVYFHGLLDARDTLRLTARAAAVVVPSVCEEACPSTVLEALLLGKTVFALRIGGTPELAAYQSGPDQLRLYDTMAQLVDALLAFSPRPDYPFAPATPTGPAEAAGRMLALYRLPPGAIGTQSAPR